MDLPEETAKELAAFIEKESKEWADQWITGRKAYLSYRKVKASGSLIESMQYQMQSTLAGEIKTALAISFDEHGRYIDMKRLNAPGGGSDLITKLTEWITRKGLFPKLERGFLERRKLKTMPQPQVALNQMAWGIAINREKGYRRRAWYAKSKAAGVNELYNRVAAGLPSIIAEELKKNFPL